MEANIIVNLVPAMAKYQKTGKQSTSPHTKYRNSKRLFTQHVSQSFLLILKLDQPLASTDTPCLPYLELPTLIIRYQGMFFLLLLLQKYQIQKSHHTQPSGDGFILQKWSLLPKLRDCRSDLELCLPCQMCAVDLEQLKSSWEGGMINS